MKPSQILVLLFVVVIFSSIGSALIFASGLHRRAGTQSDPAPSQPVLQEVTPEVGVVDYPNGSKYYTRPLFEAIQLSSSLTYVEQNQGAAEGMNLCGRSYRWAYGNIDAFEQVTQARERVRWRLVWMELCSGLNKSIASANRVFRFHPHGHLT